MDYAAGFFISDDLTTEKLGYQHVALIRKKRPDWQAGRLNAIGGKLEPGELPSEAMAREFREETGVETLPSDWDKFATLRMPGHMGPIVHFFRCFGDPSKCEQTTDEEILVYPTSLIRQSRPDTLSNLQWLLPMALDPKICPVDISYHPRNSPHESPD
jgi:8-oxo-dGTP diphosphatase